MTFLFSSRISSSHGNETPSIFATAMESLFTVRLEFAIISCYDFSSCKSNCVVCGGRREREREIRMKGKSRASLKKMHDDEFIDEYQYIFKFLRIVCIQLHYSYLGSRGSSDVQNKMSVCIQSRFCSLVSSIHK